MDIKATRDNGENFVEFTPRQPEDLLHIDSLVKEDSFTKIIIVHEKKASQALHYLHQTGRIVKGQYLVKNTPIIVSTQCIAGMW